MQSLSQKLNFCERKHHGVLTKINNQSSMDRELEEEIKRTCNPASF
jgi:hypothetical protein